MATANCNVDRGALAKPRLDVIHQIVAWDIEDGGEMGALIRCTTCDGDGTNWDFSHPKAPMMSAYSVICEMCGGSGTLHRGYSYSEPSEPMEPVGFIHGAVDTASRLLSDYAGDTDG